MPQVIQQDQAAQQQAGAAATPTPGAAQSQPKAASWNIDFVKTASAIMEPNLKNPDTLVDSAVDFSKIAGQFPTEIHLTRADEFSVIKWGAAKLGVNLDQYGDIIRTGRLSVALPEFLGMTIHCDFVKSRLDSSHSGGNVSLRTSLPAEASRRSRRRK